MWKISVVLQILLVTHRAQGISYDDFLQAIDDAVSIEMESEGFEASKLPAEVLQLMKEELYEKRVLKDFPHTTKDEMTKVCHMGGLK